MPVYVLLQYLGIPGTSLMSFNMLIGSMVYTALRRGRWESGRE